MEPHIADAESTFLAISVTPDFCRVGGKVVPYDTVAILPPEKSGYAKSVSARSEKILLIDSLVSGVQGNAGKGVHSGVSLDTGHARIMAGASSVSIEGRAVARHGDECEINGVA